MESVPGAVATGSSARRRCLTDYPVATAPGTDFPPLQSSHNLRIIRAVNSE